MSIKTYDFVSQNFTYKSVWGVENEGQLEEITVCQWYKKKEIFANKISWKKLSVVLFS